MKLVLLLQLWIFFYSWSVEKKGLLESIPITEFKYGMFFYTLQFKKMLMLVSVENPHVQIRVCQLLYFTSYA